MWETLPQLIEWRSSHDNLPLSHLLLRVALLLSQPYRRGSHCSVMVSVTERQRHLPWPPFKDLSLEARAVLATSAQFPAAVTRKRLAQQTWVDTMFPCSQ